MLICGGLAFSANESTAKKKDHPYRRDYVRSTFGKKAWYNVGSSAAFGEVINAPHEWGRGAAGFGKRIGSGFAKNAVKTAIQYPIASARHEALGYQPERTGGAGHRLKHALLATVITTNTHTGNRTVASGRIAGNFGSGFVSRLWQPARLHTVGSGFSSAGLSFGVDAGKNVVQEFWPEIRHPHRH